MTARGISFIVPVRNDAERLRVALASLATTATAAAVPFEIIVVDNGSTDQSVQVARDAGATVVELPDSKVSAMRNTAARRARFDLIAFVDADNEVVPGWAAAAMATFRDESVGACGHPYSCPSPGTWVQRAYDLLRPKSDGTHDVEWLGSGNLVIRGRVFDAVGGFDETLTTCEDVDLCQRLRRDGARLLSVSGMRSVHHGDPRTLKAVFLGELWRGRDNVRVTLRSVSLRSLASLGVSVMLALAVVVAFASIWSPATFLVALLFIAALVLMRAARMARASARRTVSFAQIVTVSAAYELGRAIALVARLSHHRRHVTRPVQAHV